MFVRHLVKIGQLVCSVKNTLTERGDLISSPRTGSKYQVANTFSGLKRTKPAGEDVPKTIHQLAITNCMRDLNTFRAIHPEAKRPCQDSHAAPSIQHPHQPSLTIKNGTHDRQQYAHALFECIASGTPAVGTFTL